MNMQSSGGKCDVEQCKYCEDTDEVHYIVSGYVAEERSDNISVSAFLHRDVMIFSANYLTLEASIRYCPMCGKRLEHNDLQQNEDDKTNGRWARRVDVLF